MRHVFFALGLCTLLALHATHASQMQKPARNAAARPDLLLQISHNASVRSIAISSDRRLLVSGSEDNTVRVWNVETGVLIRSLTGFPLGVLAVALSPTSQWIAAAGQSGVVRIFETSTGATVRTLSGHSELVTSVKFSADNRLLVSTSWDHTVKVWDVRTWAPLRTWKTSDYLDDADFSPDSRTVAAGGWDGAVRVWDVATGAEQHILRSEATHVGKVAFSPDGARLATLDFTAPGNRGLLRSPRVRVWRLNPPAEVKHFDVRDGAGFSFSPDGQRISAFSGITNGGYSGIPFAADLRLQSWLIDSGREESTVAVPVIAGPGPHRPSESSFSPDGSLLAVGTSRGELTLWDTRARQVLSRLPRDPNPIVSPFAVTFSRDRRLIGIGLENGAVNLWDVAAGEVIRSFAGHEGRVRALAFGPRDEWIVTSGDDGFVRMWDVSSGALIRENKTEGYFSALSNDGSWFVSASDYGDTLKVWDARTGTLRRTLRPVPNGSRALAISPDDSRVCATSGKMIRCWNAATGVSLLEFEGASSVAYGLTFSPDGRQLAGGIARVLKVWDAFTGAELLRMPSAAGSVDVVTFLDPNHIISGGANTAKLWSLTKGTLVRTFAGHTSGINALALEAVDDCSSRAPTTARRASGRSRLDASS